MIKKFLISVLFSFIFSFLSYSVLLFYESYKSYDSIEVHNNPLIVYNKKNLPTDILKIIQEKYPFHKSTYSYTVQDRYIANTCEYCSALQGDFYLYEEPDGAFFDIDQLKPKYFIGLKNGKLYYI